MLYDNNAPASQYAGLGEILRNWGGKANTWTQKPDTPGVLANLGKIVLDMGNVRGQPINALNNAMMYMTGNKRSADMLNKAGTLPTTNGVGTVPEGQSTIIPHTRLEMLGPTDNDLYLQKILGMYNRNGGM